MQCSSVLRSRALFLAKQYKLHYLLIGVLFLAVLPSLTYGQATIVGTVTDPSGATVPNVTVTVTNTDTGWTRTLPTNEAGQYVVPDIQIGHYNVKAVATGFKVAEQKGILLQVGDRTRVDFQMTVGAATETVTVEGVTIAVQTDSGHIGQIITGEQVSQLATNGRSIYGLVNLTPGATSSQPDFQTPTPVGGNSQVSFNGQRLAHNIYLLDGGEDLDRGGAGTFSIMPSVDALAEFQTLTSNYSADYGLSSGATMTTVLKSGTKDFHFSLWEFNRNNALDARNFFNPAPAKVAKLNFNTYGFNVGGPVTFGKLYNPDKEKTFFFYNMEWRKLIQGGLVNQTVPAAGTYGGDFGSTVVTVPSSVPVSVLARNCPGGVLPAGITPGSAFPNNTIPTCMLDPNAQSLLTAGGKYGGIFPAATGVNGSGQPVFQGGNNSPTDVREEIVRIDHRFNSKFSVFGHFVAEQISQTFGTTMWSGDNVPSMSNTFGNPSYSGVVHATHVINPSLINEIAFNYNGNRINILPTGLYAAPSGFTFNRLYTGTNALNRIPSIQLAGGTGTSYTSAWEPWVNKADDYQIRDDVSWTKGAHQLKMGASWAIYKKIQDVFTNTQGNFTFDGSFSGNDFADYLLGLSNSYSEDAVKDNGHWNNVSWAAYVQDNWRVNNRLTLNLGLRWDGAPHTYEANHRDSNFYANQYNAADAPIFLADGTISPSSPGLGTSPNPILAGYQFYMNGLGLDGLNGTPKGMVNNHWAAFGPRLGFAYDVNGHGKTVIRGGFGIMYERIQGNDMYNTGGNEPFSAHASFNNVLLSNPKTDALTGTTITVPPLPIAVLGITGLDINNYKLPSSTQYSLGVQHSIGKTVLSVSYVGTMGRHQSDQREINMPAASDLPAVVAAKGANYNSLVPYLGYRGISLAENEANAIYNSLQVSWRGNVAKDLDFQFGYTYSKSWDPSYGNTDGTDLSTVADPYAGWKAQWGPSVLDRTHVAFANFVYNIPFLRHSDNAPARIALGGWTVSGIVSMQSGGPLNIGISGSNITSYVQNSANRPDLVGSISYPHTVNEWFDINAFARPCDTCWGTLTHDALRGPGRDNWNLSLFKSFIFSEKRNSRLEFRAEAFNVWNHTQFQGDVLSGGISTNASFVCSVSGVTPCPSYILDPKSNFGHITNAFDPRVFQLGLKLIF